MVILHFAEYASGGIATYLKNLIASQVKRKDVKRVYLLVSEYNSDAALLNMKDNKLTVLEYKYKRSAFGVLKLLRLSSIINKINPDVIHIHSSFAGIVRLKYLFSNRKKSIVYCSHGWAFNREISTWKKAVYKFIELILSAGCNRIINISKFEQNSAKFISPKKMFTIYNSIPPRNKSLNTKSHRGLDLVFIGRLDRQKGIDLLISAMHAVNHDGYLNLTVVGDSIVDPIVRKHNTKSIKFLGWQNSKQVQSIIETGDVLVVPSRWEGFGLVSLEAMSVGKMVVASDAGALPEIVLNRKTGLIFKANSGNALANVLEDLQKMPKDMIENLGEQGEKRYYTSFSYPKMVDEVMAVYSK